MVRYALQRVGAMARFRRAGWQSNWRRAWLGTGTGEQPRLCCANLRHVLPQRGDRRRVNAMLRQRGARDALVGCQGVRDVEQREETVGCECPGQPDHNLQVDLGRDGGEEVEGEERGWWREGRGALKDSTVVRAAGKPVGWLAR